MKDQFIPYEQALKLKDFGFNKDCFTYYHNENDLGDFCLTGGYTNDSAYQYLCSAPLWQQAFDWFTSKGLHSYIEGAYPWFRYYINTKDDRYEGHKYSTITEARLSCLDKLIELCQHRNEASNQ